jgi:lipid-binding SYLF domain-containing protein
MGNKKLDLVIKNALNKFYGTEGTKDISERAAGILVFPSVVKAGLFGFGGSYGQGGLVVKGDIQSYYNIVSASFGFQLGIQQYSLLLLFLTKDALDDFVNSDGWQIGVNASVAIIEFGAGAVLNTDSIKDSVVAVVFDQAGLMYSLSLEGTKISRQAG